MIQLKRIVWSNHQILYHNYSQDDLNKLRYLIDSNYMTLSTKTKYMMFSYRGSTVNEGNIHYKCGVRICKETITISNACTAIERCNSIKYLGLIVDEN